MDVASDVRAAIEQDGCAAFIFSAVATFCSAGGGSTTHGYGALPSLQTCRCESILRTTARDVAPAASIDTVMEDDARTDALRAKHTR